MLERLLTVLACAAALSACAQKSAYEAAVEDREPVYCYQSLGNVVCHEKPNFHDERRMVNYFGPAPQRYERPAPAAEQKLSAPEPVNYWVKDPVPLPRAAPKGNLSDRPWIAGAPAYDAAASDRVPTEQKLLAGTRLVNADAPSPGTDALLSAIGAANVKE